MKNNTTTRKFKEGEWVRWLMQHGKWNIGIITDANVPNDIYTIMDTTDRFYRAKEFTMKACAAPRVFLAIDELSVI